MSSYAPRRTILWANGWGNGRIEVAKHPLSARQVQTADEGDHIDGEGLSLRVKAKSASWLLRYTVQLGKLSFYH